MKLIPRRKQEPTNLEKALAVFSKVFQALAAVRMARGALKGYRFMRRLPLLLGGAAAAALVARKLRGKSGNDAPVPQPAPAPTPTASKAPSSDSIPTPPPAPSSPGATDEKSRAEAAVATSAGLADAEATTGGQDGATDSSAGSEKPA